MKRKVNMIVIHTSATKENRQYTFEDCIRDHKARGFATCGYHRFIRRDGTVHIGRSFDRIGAHVSNFNRSSIGICYEGGYDKNGKAADTRTEAQKQALLNCICEAIGYSEGKVTQILGHRDLSPDLNNNGIVEPNEWIKICPCFDAVKEYKHLLG